MEREQRRFVARKASFATGDRPTGEHTDSMPRKEPCLAAAEKAEAEAATHRPTAQQKRDRISELEERARRLSEVDEYILKDTKGKIKYPEGRGIVMQKLSVREKARILANFPPKMRVF